jgi:hypothetical protein
MQLTIATIQQGARKFGHRDKTDTHRDKTDTHRDKTDTHRDKTDTHRDKPDTHRDKTDAFSNVPESASLPNAGKPLQTYYSR